MPQRTLNDITAGELWDLEADRPELFADPPRLARYLDLIKSEMPELIDLLESRRKLSAAIKRITYPFRLG